MEKEDTMKHSILFSGCIISLLLLFSCQHATFPTPGTIYFTSFESKNDIQGWKGFNTDYLVFDPSPGGGEKSLRFNKVAYIDIPVNYPGKRFTINLWEKVDRVPRSCLVVLKVSGSRTNKDEEVRLIFESEDWSFLSSEKSIDCPTGKSLRIEIIAGGFVGGSIFVDQLSVVIVD